MKSTVEEKWKVFVHVCELGRLITQAILENYNDELAGERDKCVYWDKGKWENTIKTIYGEVTYFEGFIR